MCGICVGHVAEENGAAGKKESVREADGWRRASGTLSCD